MTDHAGLLDQYQRTREVRFRLNNLLVKMVPKTILDECARILGFLQNGVMVFDTEDEVSVLMDYAIYYPGPAGRNLVAKYLEKSPPAADSDEMKILQAMTHAYYTLLQVVGVERGIGVSVRDLLRDETSFMVDVGLGNTGRPQMMLATRIIPMEGFLVTGGAGLPVVASAAKRIFNELIQKNQTPESFDFHQMRPQQEAELAALIIRACRSTGMSSHIAYEEPGSPARLTSSGSAVRRIGRNDPCPCGSGKKFKACCRRD